MAFLQVQVAGPVIAPSGLPPHAAKIEFRLRSYVTADDTLAVPQMVTANVIGGAINTALIGSPEGIVYDVDYVALLAGHRRRIPMGLIVVDGAGPFALADLVEQTVRIPLRVKAETSLKRGDTLSFGMIWVGEYNQRLDHGEVDISASLLGPDGVKRALEVEKLSPSSDGEVEVSMPASETALLPLGDHQIDIKFSLGARVSRTATGTITVLQEITP
jgi:hypothetical protein